MLPAAPPQSVRWAALVVAVEGAALLVAGFVYAGAGLVGRPESRVREELAAALAVATGALVLVLARGLRGCRPWSRSPVVVLQLLVIPVGLGLIQGGIYPVGVPMVALGAAVLYALASPTARLALREGGGGGAGGGGGEGGEGGGGGGGGAGGGGGGGGELLVDE